MADAVLRRAAGVTLVELLGDLLRNRRVRLAVLPSQEFAVLGIELRQRRGVADRELGRQMGLSAVEVRHRHLPGGDAGGHHLLAPRDGIAPLVEARVDGAFGEGRLQGVGARHPRAHAAVASREVLVAAAGERPLGRVDRAFDVELQGAARDRGAGLADGDDALIVRRDAACDQLLDRATLPLDAGGDASAVVSRQAAPLGTVLLHDGGADDAAEHVGDAVDVLRRRGTRRREVEDDG